MSFSVDGIISGLNTESIISQLLAIETRPILKLQQQEADYQVQLTAYGSLKGLLSNIKSAAQGLDAISDLTGFSASSGDIDFFTASAGSSATAGTHNVTVKQLAQAHMVKSTDFAETDQVIEFNIGATNKYIDFKEDAGSGFGAELTATLTEGYYTVSELKTEIETQLEAASDAGPNNVDYTVSYDSTAKKFTIEERTSILTATGLEILWNTGTNNANTVATTLGYDNTADDTGATTYTGANEVGEGTIHLEIGTTLTIDSSNNKLNFKEDKLGGDPLSAELTATITSGTYTISELEAEIKTRLDAASVNGITYTVSYDNSTKKFNIQGAGLDELKLLWKTGTNGSDNTGTSVASVLGYSIAADDESATSHTAANTVGTVDDISISATDTIQDVADAINAANAGVTATVIYDGTSKYYLSLSSDTSGDANVVSLMVTDIDGDNTDSNGLSRLAYHEGFTTNLTQTQDAQDALIHVDGITDISRSTNTITDVITGVTITLVDVHAVPATDKDTLTVSRNTATVVSKISAFVSAYNSAYDFFKTNQGYDAETKVVGLLQGDATTNQIRNRLSRLNSQKVPGVTTFSRLSDLGVRLNAEGHLEVNSTTLNSALSDHSDDVLQFFTQTTAGSEGFGVRMVDALEGFLDSYDGTLTSRTTGIRDSIDKLEDKAEQLTTRIQASEIRLKARFDALEVLLGQFQTTSGVVTQQVASLKNLNSYISGL